MTWKPGDPARWPAKWGLAAEESSLTGEPVLVYKARSVVEAKRIRENLYRWKFDLRERGSSANRGFTLVDDIKISIVKTDLFIECSPSLASRLIDLNPWLRGFI